FDGDLDDYAAWLRSRPQDAKAAGAAPKVVAAVAAPPPPAPKPPRTKVNPHRLAQAEARVAALETAISGIDADFADPAFHDGPDAPARAADAAQRRAVLAS